jgi:pimeloyl-ACP methyl ester carboxylesterase
MLQFNPPAMIRGNASEIISLAGATGELCRGVESAAESSAAISAAQTLARRTGAAVLVTGATDYATDGHTTIACHNGHEIMTRVTGVGCAMGGLAAACTAVADSPLEAAKRSTVPILFVHGESDDFVPCDMSRTVYDACVSHKGIVTFPGAGHGLSYLVDPEGYLQTLRNFFDPILKPDSPSHK